MPQKFLIKVQVVGGLIHAGVYMKGNALNTEAPLKPQSPEALKP